MKEHYTKEQLTEELIDDLEDELEGIMLYDKIYNSMIAHGMHSEAKIIERIAEDEYHHACAIRDMLMEMDVDLSEHEKIHSNWECVKKIFDI